MRLTFLGAAAEVTGSQHLVESEELKLLLDCGLFQGHRAQARAKNEQFRFDPRQLDAVILSHAHIDHCGNLPRLYRQGFRGPVFCSSATADVAEIMLQDSAKIQSEDSKYLKRKLKGSHPPFEPLYELDDVKGLMKLIEPIPLNQWYELNDAACLRLLDAGHILGSSIVELDLEEQGVWKRVVFSGDLGRRNLPLLRDPSPVERCDVLICESTYGNRIHPPTTNIKLELKRILHEAYQVGGRVIVPAFSLGRTQHLVYFLNELYNEGQLPRIPVFVDSPLATRLTRVYRDHLNEMDEHVQEILDHDHDPFGFPWLTYVGSQRESIALNHREGAFMVISASGMCESGRVVHHLKNAISDLRNTIVMIGFQARNTTGRKIKDQQQYIRIFDRDYKLKAHVEQIDGLSAHADVSDFKWWFEQIAQRGGIGQAFLVHGEEESAQALAEVIKDHCDLDPIIPQRGDSFEIV